MQRREAILGTGFLLAAIGEIVFAATFLPMGNLVEAVCLFAAGAGLMLCSGGAFFAEARGGSLLVGLAAAAAGHVAYLAVSPSDLNATLLANVGAALAAVGFVIAAWAARASDKVDARMLRAGLAVGALAGVVWTIVDLQNVDYAFTTGDIFLAVGLGTAAWFAASEVVAPAA